MRKIIFICFAFVISGIASSQTSKQSFPKGVKQANKGIKTKSRKDNKENNCLFSKRMDFAPISSDYKLFSNGISEQIIGKTYYDLQTNNSIQNRLFVHDDNTISATCTMSPDFQTDFPNRGTGYNYFDGTSWMDIPESRIEEKRTGWPSIAVINGGKL